MKTLKPIKVVVLLGQSNMEGHSHISYLNRHFSNEQTNQYNNGFPLKIAFMSNRGLNNSNNKFVSVKTGQGIDPTRFGPEVGIAELLTKNGLNDEVFIIKYAVGATNLEVAWRSPSSENTGECYIESTKFIDRMLLNLENDGYLPKIHAFCYMQGESDACDGGHNEYYIYLLNLIKDLRKHYDRYASKDGIYFIDAGISDCSSWIHYQTINNAKKAISLIDDKYLFIDTLKYKLSYQKEPDFVADIHHYDSNASIILGHLFAEQIMKTL